MINAITRLFRRYTVLTLATMELEDAMQAKNQADSMVDYYRGISQYNRDRVSRLRDFIRAEEQRQREDEQARIQAKGDEQ
jgi:hypothetical protein